MKFRSRIFRIGRLRSAGRLAVALLALASACVAGTAFAQGVLSHDGAPPPKRNPVVAAASNVGVRQCLPALAALSSIGVRDARNSDVLFDWDRRRPNEGPVFSLLGLETAGGNAAMSVNAVPAAGGACSVLAERIEFEAHPCQQIAQRELHGYQATRLLPHMTVYATQQEPGSTVSLIDSAPGCLSIRRYVNFAAGNAAGGGAQ
ncbi:hypothetical protein CY652_18655 [Burkholderia sp. WAC0059]|uniref:hypothetical protein n=1 Tax=Burkholderia sp. WAC0059 TaxID=2066022 RepID=UPI000C7F2FC4|nr:hypothetical protein [Burkholderia sp. WAC0059]PLZ00872.1 hypothetical protein CY652_18655 [Burkholderia sp. WAC0059]